MLVPSLWPLRACWTLQLRVGLYLLQHTAHHLRLRNRFFPFLRDSGMLRNSIPGILSVNSMAHKELWAHNTEVQHAIYVSMFCQWVTWWEGPSLGTMATGSCLLFQEMPPQQSICTKQTLQNQNKSRILGKIPRMLPCALHLEFRKLRNHTVCGQERRKPYSLMGTSFTGRNRTREFHHTAGWSLLEKAI